MKLRLFDGHEPAAALAAAQHSGFVTDGELATYDRTVDVDQWTVSAVLEEHRPLHRVAVGDEGGTVVYVSDTTGQIVRDTHRAPSYTVVDASVRFDVSDKIGLTLKADNIFDELYATSNYYEETWLVGKPRTASIAFDFSF